jgi:glycogen(starch) synthase
MRVGLLTNNVMPPREGIGRHVLEIARRLPRHGVEPLIVARGQGLRWQSLEVEGVPVRLFPYLPVRPFHQEALRLVLQRWLDQGAEGCDALHLHLPLLPPLRTALRRVVTFHSPLLSDTAAIGEPGLKAALIKANARLFSQAYEHAHIRDAAALVAVSANVRDELARHYRLLGRRVAVIGNGVDTGVFTYRGGPRPPDADGRRSVLYVGRLGYRKGLHRLLDAFACLGDGRLRLELAGEGPLLEKLQAQARNLGIAERVCFLGFLDGPALLAALHRAAVLVNPADYESGPLTLLEAMAGGTPVVTTSTGLAAELPEPRPCVVAERNPLDLATAIARVLADPEAAAAMARQARRLVLERFAWDDVVRRLVDRYGHGERLAA